MCRNMLLLTYETINEGNENIFGSLKKMSKAKNEKKYNDNFRKVVISNLLPDALRDLHASKYKRRRNKPNDGCLWKPAKRNSVCASKQLRYVAITEIFNGNQAL